MEPHTGASVFTDRLIRFGTVRNIGPSVVLVVCRHGVVLVPRGRITRVSNAGVFTNISEEEVLDLETVEMPEQRKYEWWPYGRDCTAPERARIIP